MIEYDIWKIVGCGRKQTRYYEDQSMFTKYFHKFKTHYYWGPRYDGEWHAYRFTSEGWKEIT